MTSAIAAMLMSPGGELMYPYWRIQVELRGNMLSNKPRSNQNIGARPISALMSLHPSVPLCKANAIPWPGYFIFLTNIYGSGSHKSSSMLLCLRFFRVYLGKVLVKANDL